jgi:hypothetical protein
MFLDDKLLGLCRESEVDTPEKIQALNVVLFDTCSEYFKSSLTPTMTHGELRNHFKKIFNIWDSFVLQLKKSDDFKLNVLYELFEKHSFKVQLLKNNEGVRKIYNNINK